MPISANESPGSRPSLRRLGAIGRRRLPFSRRAFGVVGVHIGLQVDPKPCAGAEHAGKARGYLRLQTNAAVDDLAQVLARAAERGREPGDGNTPRLQVILAQDDSRQGRTALELEHGQSPQW